ncbi:CAP domain-containing protein [Caballeronia sp. GACF4]|uniref:CAP domain-containing protein n=1 Tax=Caballeronia sp. GACF4 TaxID=2921763 RepID=UPI0020288C18|nr:CAP domain-containing protein [Caballeronia sp. GACF4]
MNKTIFAIAATALLAAACGGGGDHGGAATTPSGSSSPGSNTSGNGSTATPVAISLLTPTGASAGGVPAPTGDVVNDSFAFINAMRNQLSLSSLKFVSQVATAAQNHALYMQSTNGIGHYETAGQPNYTGVTPSDRVAAVGYTTNSVGEIAAGYTGAFHSSTQAIDGLFDAPFHRSIFLFDTTGVGVGQAANTDPVKFSTLVADFVDYVAATPDNKLIAYPYEGQTNVKPSWEANESPNPMANAPQYIMKTVGYPVTLSAANNGAFSNVKFAITDALGAAVPCEEIDNSNNSESTRLAMCTPYAPLVANTTYKVAVTGSLSNTSFAATPFSVSWSFTTGAAPAATAKAARPAGSSTPPVFN